MYAYKQQTQVRPLHAVPNRLPVTRPVVRKKKVVKKKKNPILNFFRMTLALSFIGAYAYFVFPSTYNDLTKQVFYPTNTKEPIISYRLLKKEIF